jgi:SAM-dependent methyltransferase
MNAAMEEVTNSNGDSFVRRCNPSTDGMRSFMQALRAQFGRPTGFWGGLAGTIMAHRPSNKERNTWTVSLLNLRPADRVLEIGFGPGLAIDEICRTAPRSFVAGVDHSEVMLRQARKRNAAAIRQGRVDLQLGTISNLPNFGEPFDKILAVNSFQFWDAPLARLKELRSLLKPGGVIAVTIQPRWRGATDADAEKVGNEMTTQLAQAGFSRIRLEVKPLKPVSAVCALGER